MLARFQVWLFIFLLMFLGFCGGMFIASLVISAKSDGFTGSAVAIWYGIGGLLAGLLAGIFVSRGLKQQGFRIALIIVIIISLLVTLWIIQRVKTLKERRADPSMGSQPLKKGTVGTSFREAVLVESDTSLPIGIGMAKPHLEDGKLIYFYHTLSIDSRPDGVRPYDSIVIKKGEYHFEISYAPPWFFPAEMKLDYDILFLQVLSISRNWLEVAVNKQTGQTCWISAMDADFIDWSTFLLNVYDVELIDPDKNPLRLKPLEHASIIATTPDRFSLHPLAIHGDWIMVSTLGLADRIVPYGWIRWRKNDRLLIRYSLLS